MNKFNSQICTTTAQSQRLLDLGLKSETADTYMIRPIDYLVGEKHRGHIPAWSSARLLEMIPKSFREDDKLFYLNIYTDADFYDFEYESNVIDYGDYDDYEEHTISIGYGYDAELYEALIETIQILIQRGHFNKEYLKL